LRRGGRGSAAVVGGLRRRPGAGFCAPPRKGFARGGWTRAARLPYPCGCGI